MARAVQRRPSPPYLLIFFVALFLLAMTLAVVFWVRNAQLTKDYEQLAANSKRIFTEQEVARAGAALREMLRLYDNPPQGMERRTVLSQQAERISTLIERIVGRDTTYEDALSQIDALGEDVFAVGGQGLVGIIRNLNEQLTAERAAYAETSESLEKLREELESTEKQMQELSAQAARDMAKLRDQLRAKEQQVAEMHERHLADLKRAREELEDVRNRLTRDIVKRSYQIQEYLNQLEKKDARITVLLKRLDELSPETKDVVARQPDGEVLRVLAQENVCYINIGSKDRVVPGLAFTVYPSVGIPSSGEGKGQLVVINVREDVSECRIVSERLDNPINVGDLVANVAFDARRNYKFVVEGEFDLRGVGEPSVDQTREVEILIERSGGEIVDEVTIETDFVVLGEEPVRPPRPPESAPPADWTIYQQQLRRYERYHEVMRTAQSMQVPILNTNRFLAFIGYAAAKPPMP